MIALKNKFFGAVICLLTLVGILFYSSTLTLAQTKATKKSASRQRAARRAAAAVNKALDNQAKGIKNAALAAPAKDANGKDIKAPPKPLPNELDPKMMDLSLVKANLLEGLLTEKVTKIIETQVPEKNHYRASVSVAVRRLELPPKPEPVAKEEKKQAQAYRPEAPVAEGSIFDLQRLVDHYEEEMEAVKRISRPINVSISSDKNESNANTFYEVEKVNVLISFDDSIRKEVIEAVEGDVKKALEPVFNDRLELQSSTTKIAPGFGERLTTWLQKMQTLVTALALGAILIFAILLHKIIPSWQSRLATLTENKSDEKKDIEQKKKPSEEGEEEPTSDENTVDGPSPTSTKESLISLKELSELENQVSGFSKQNPKIVHALLQEWSGNEDRIESLALMLETLARHSVTIPRVEVRGAVLKKIKSAKSDSAELTLENKYKKLYEIYWSLISMSFVGEELAVSPFLFLESVPDNAVMEMILEESVEAKSSILMGLNDRRAAKVLSLLPALEREQIFGQICSGVQGLDSEQTVELLERLKEKVKEHLVTHDRRLESIGSGVEALAPILQTMDFTAQFSTAKSLMNLDVTLRRTLELLYFNVAFLPDAKQEFLSGLFVDRPGEWIRSICSKFDEEFKQRVISLLPPMQQQMISDDNSPVSDSAAMNALKELDDQVWERVLKKEILLSEIFSAGENTEQQGATTNAAA